MAKPAGCIESADGGWTLDDPTSIPILLVLHRQLAHWDSATPPGGMHFTVWRQLAIDGANGSEERFYGLGGLSTVEAETGPVTASWAEYTEAAPLYPSGNYDLDLGFADGGTEPTAVLGRLLASCDNRGSGELMGLYFIATTTYDYGTPTPALTRYLEPLARNTDANSWRPHDMQRPASAWLLQRGISEAYDRILWTTRQAWSVLL